MGNRPALIINTSTGLMAYAAADDNIPAGFIAADGSTIDGTSTTYAQLGSLIGTRYGGTARSALTLPSLISSGGQPKTTSTAATNTVTETDLLNGEFTVAANLMGTTRALRFHAFGDWVQTSGAGAAMPRFKVKFGSGPTTVIDTGAPGNTTASTAARYGWWFDFVWQATGATNTQWIAVKGNVGCTPGASASGGDFTTGNGRFAASGHLVGGAATTIDTTASQALQLTVINPSATNTETKLQGAYYVIEGT